VAYRHPPTFNRPALPCPALPRPDLLLPLFHSETWQAERSMPAPLSAHYVMLIMMGHPDLTPIT